MRSATETEMQRLHPKEAEMKESPTGWSGRAVTEPELCEKRAGREHILHSDPQHSWNQNSPLTAPRLSSSCIPVHADTTRSNPLTNARTSLVPKQVTSQTMLKKYIYFFFKKLIFIFQESLAKILFCLALIKFHKFQLGAKHNAAFNLRHKTGLPNSFGGSTAHPLFSSAYWPTYSACPNPRCYCVKQTHHSSSTEGHNYPGSFRAHRGEGLRRNSGNGTSLD